MDAIVYIGIGFILGAALAAVAFLYRQSSLQSNVQTQAAKKSELEQQNKTLAEEAKTARENSIRLQAEKEAFERQILEQRQNLKTMEEALLHKFENLSNKIYSEKSGEFKKQSQETLGNLLNPLKEKIAEFHKKVDDSFGDQMKEQISLKEHIKSVVFQTESLKLHTESLTNALKNDSKTQGDWGEVLLENILQSSGLQKDKDYVLQGTGMGLKHPETGSHQKPDVTVNLPDGKHVLIDSKVSLTHYERYWAENDEDARTLHLSQFLESMKKHVRDLEERRYQDTYGLGTPEIVLMFVPIEGAFMFAIQHDRELHEYAWNKKVAIVCPSTLFATLKTIASLWKLVRQNQNAQEIARQSGALYDKVEGFLKDMRGIKTQLDKAGESYDGAMKKLTGQGGIISRTEKLKSLGAKTSKSLPVELTGVEAALEEEADNIEPFEGQKRA